MDLLITANTMTITGMGSISQVDTAVQHQAGAQIESVSLSVLIASAPTQTAVDLQQQAIRRAIELLESALLENRQQE